MKKIVKVAIIGSPNVGKSSLLNFFIGTKNSIVSPKPHTTRDSILGILNEGDTQVVFVDTPGYIKKGTSIWADHFIDATLEAVKNVDLILVVVDATATKTHGTPQILEKFAPLDKTIVAVNKIDLRAKGRLYPVASEIAAYGYKNAVFLVSSKSGDGAEDLKKFIVNSATEGEWEFENNEEAQMKKEVYAAECVREKAFYCLDQELPFSIWTVPTKWSFRKDWRVEVDIIVTKESHKRIVIGRGAELIKKISMSARTELEALWGKGQLFANVVVDAKWCDDPEMIKAICMGTAY